MQKIRLRKLSPKSDYDEWLINGTYIVHVKMWGSRSHYLEELKAQIKRVLETTA